MDDAELKRRREARDQLGWDECGASGQGHNPDNTPQPDGLWYCRYCGAELLPEEAAECVEIKPSDYDRWQFPSARGQ